MDFVYVALLKDYDGEYNVLTAQSTREGAIKYAKDYFGLYEDKPQVGDAEFLGYRKMEYSEYEDPLEGYLKFKDDAGDYTVYIYCMYLDELCI